MLELDLLVIVPQNFAIVSREPFAVIFIPAIVWFCCMLITLAWSLIDTIRLQKMARGKGDSR